MLRLAILLALAGAGTAQAGALQLDPGPLAPTQARQPAFLTAEAQAAAAMTLPPELRAVVVELGFDRGVATLDRVRRLYEYMVSEQGLGLRYREQPTHGLAESYATREVNCLSFTMMFIALARASGIDAYAQASNDALAMRVLEDTVYRAHHVKAGVDIDGVQYTVDVGWRAVVAEEKPRRISDVQLVALLHNNNAVERLLAGDLPSAMAETGRMLALDSDNATIWSNAGVVNWRSGRTQPAEQAYLKALQIQDDHLGALSNLVALYRTTGEERLAAQYGKRLKKAQAMDPFSQFLLAEQLVRQGAYGEALGHYRRAIRLLPNQATFHRGMAEAYRQKGDLQAAQRALQRAESIELRKYSQRGIQDADANS